eukprot:TRINITY_DN17729_c0_g1_i2.p1 TRINITY_DN17729_c0_g1~~TRINITY_DN17729_c0_g1_i2.p1  ORF type:complete len:244 (-),score=42.13 TRINITY_DN17729_c0_g1_i2:117-791(-)
MPKRGYCRIEYRFAGLALWFFATQAAADDPPHGALGKGSENIDPKTAKAAIGNFRSELEAPGDPLRKHGVDLACSACQLIADRFTSKVARKIYGKMAADKKRSIFHKHLAEPCLEKAWPDQIAHVERFGVAKYIDFKEALANREGKVSVKRMAPELKTNLIEACKSLLETEQKQALLDKILATPPGSRASDVNFRSWLCGKTKANVCVKPSDLEEADDEDEAEL